MLNNNQSSLFDFELTKTMSRIIIIGSGFAGLSSACYLAKEGHDVTVIEKNEGPGGRCSIFKQDGFTFDMGPSWYWMPEVFENFYQHFGKSTDDFYMLTRLDPSYRVFFKNGNQIDVPAGEQAVIELFESLEKGAGAKLKRFLSEAKYKYEVGMNEFVWKPSHSILEFMDFRIAQSALKLKMFSSISSEIKKQFTNPMIIELLEFPVLFLGAKPSNTPALYSLMNYADISLGTWYPQGGMYEITKAMYSIALEQGVKFKFNEKVTSIKSKDKTASKVISDKSEYVSDFVIANADYRFVDQVLLEEKDRNYSHDYWEKREMAPSSLLYYLGVNKRVEGLIHHNLFFDKDFTKHAEEIYDHPQWPTDPLFYACVPSKTDSSVAPVDYENLFLLMPLAPGLNDSEELRERYFDIMIDRLERITNQDIKKHVIFKRSFAMADFESRYNSFKGNAYGLANTLKQTAFLKPKLKNKKLDNLFYTGQLTTPGPGVPPSIISGCVVANEILKQSI